MEIQVPYVRCISKMNSIADKWGSAAYSYKTKQAPQNESLQNKLMDNMLTR